MFLELKHNSMTKKTDGGRNVSGPYTLWARTTLLKEVHPSHLASGLYTKLFGCLMPHQLRNQSTINRNQSINQPARVAQSIVTLLETSYVIMGQFHHHP